MIIILLNYGSHAVVAMQSLCKINIECLDWKQITSFAPDSCHKKITDASGLLPLLIKPWDPRSDLCLAYHCLDPASSPTCTVSTLACLFTYNLVNYNVGMPLTLDSFKNHA